MIISNALGVFIRELQKGKKGRVFGYTSVEIIPAEQLMTIAGSYILTICLGDLFWLKIVCFK